MNHGQAVDEHGDVIAVVVVSCCLVLVENLEFVGVDVCFVEEADVFGGAVVAGEELDVAVLLELGCFLLDAFLLIGDDGGEEAIPFGVGEADPVECFELVSRVK